MNGLCVKVQNRGSISTRDKPSKSNVKLMTAYLILVEYRDNTSMMVKIRIFLGTLVYQMVDYIVFYT